MSQPVKLSDELVTEARIVGAAMGRSIASQIEFWANIGMTVERVTTGAQQVNLLHKFSHAELIERIASVDKPEGRARLKAYLNTRPFPRFWAHATEARVFIREEADGTETVGRFEGREFVLVDLPAVTSWRETKAG